MQNEISTVMEDIKVISELVVKQQIEWAANPRHNEYMQLQWNVGVLKDKLSELQELMKFK
jgi:hypothetical protein